MGKNHRHLKTLKSERNKTKLKDSGTKKAKDKHLPKGLNVTNTAFKVKQIVIRDQLKAPVGDEIITKRQFNIKDLLKKLHNPNTNFRNEALTGLKDALTFSAQSLLSNNLYDLLQKCSELILDIERSVRRETLKVLQLIVANVDQQQLGPFFHVLVSYMCCAMTHLNTNIQEDSLLLLDVLLTHCPALVAKNYDKIMSNFINLISNLRTDSKPGRTLAVNLGSTMTSVRWRIKVLSRLNKILQAVIDKNNSEKSSEQVVAPVFINEVGTHIPLLHNQFLLEPFDYNSMNLNEKSEEDKYIDIIVPLLFETWLEVCPNKSMLNRQDINFTSTISQDAASTLICIVNIFHMLWTHINASEQKVELKLCSTFVKKYNQKFLDFIFKKFPYSQHGCVQTNKGDKKNANMLEVNSDPKCVRENLLICYMYVVMNRNLQSNSAKENANQVINYLHACLKNRNYLNDKPKYMMLVLKEIINENSKRWCKAEINISGLLKSMVHFEEHAKLHDDAREELFSLICDVVPMEHLNSTSAFQVWLAKLPDLLLNPTIPLHMVKSMLLLAKQNNKVFFQAFLNKLPIILDNISKINIIGCLRRDKIELLSIFYYLPALENRNMDDLSKYFVENKGDPHAEKLKSIIGLDLEMQID